MLCPFCQRELDVEKMSCANCGAEFPTTGSALWGAKFRTFLIGGGLAVVGSMMLVSCILNQLPGGRDSGYRAPGSPQAAIGPGPDLKDPDVQALLLKWNKHAQQSQNPLPPPPRR